MGIEPFKALVLLTMSIASLAATFLNRADSQVGTESTIGFRSCLFWGQSIQKEVMKWFVTLEYSFRILARVSCFAGFANLKVQRVERTIFKDSLGYCVMKLHEVGSCCKPVSRNLRAGLLIGWLHSGIPRYELQTNLEYPTC